MIYIRDTIPCKILEKHSCPNNIECLFTELNFRKCKWLLCKICKNMQNPSCIDLLLSSNSCTFQQTTTVCSGFSDCHKLILTILKTSIPKENPRRITYRDYKQFNSLKFNNELKNVLTTENIDNCTKFDEKFLEVLDQHAPLKQKLLRANHASYVSKA